MPHASAARVRGLLLLVVVAALWPRAGLAQTDVLTAGYDNARTGANTTERELDTIGVQYASFGRLFGYTLDGPVFSQPLVATRVAMRQGPARDLVYFATGMSSVYAYDTSGGADALVWRRTLERVPGVPGSRPRGILSTPVIDRAAGLIYVVASYADSGRIRFLLHALDLATGEAHADSPAEVRGAIRLDGTTVTFDPSDKRMGVQRAALALAGDHVIVAFGGDFFEGWVFAFDRRDLRAAPAAFCTTCASRVPAVSGVDYLDEACTFLGPAGGVWQAGRAPVVDDRGHVYFFTGNKAHVVRQGCRVPPGTNACSTCTDPAGCVCEGVGDPKVCRGPDTCEANATADGRALDVHDALIGLDPANGLSLTGWYRPGNWNIAGPEGLEINDLDLGGSGPVLLPGTNRLVGAGKQGVMYVLDISRPDAACVPALGRTCFGADGANPVQDFAVAPPPPAPNQYYRHVFGGPVVWARGAAGGGTLAYVWREHDHLRAYRLTDRFADCERGADSPAGSWSCPPVAMAEDYIGHHPGGILALSSNGSSALSGIVWAATTQLGAGRGKLMAFRAVPREDTPDRLDKLWDSDGCAGDAIEGGSGFLPPTVANGRVYYPTQNGTVEVFGLIDTRECQGPDPSLAPPTLQM